MVRPSTATFFSRIPPAAVYRNTPPGSGPGNPRQRPPGLIIPGQSSSKPGKLFLPGQQPAQNQPPMESPDLQEPRKRFRPPPGYLSKTEESGDEAVAAEAATAAASQGLSVEDMLKKLETGAEKWYLLARYVDVLVGEGMDANVVEEMAGLTKAEQNCMAVAADVRMSLERDREVSEEVMEYYEVAGVQRKLYALRFLTGKARVRAAEYIAEKGLDEKDSQDLAKAVKEHSRRKGQKDGFSDDTEDCLAYKFYRYAVETRQMDKVLEYIEKGLDVALTPSAVAALESLKEQTIKSEDESETRCTLEMVKLMKDDVSCRPIAVAGFFNEVTASELLACPLARRQGGFRTFVTNGGQEATWLVLPTWEIVEKARKPVALEFRDCHDSIPAAAAKALAPTPEKRKKLKGGALVLVDRLYGPISRDSYYVVELEDGRLDIVPGIEGLLGVCARVIILVRPPDQILVHSSLSDLEI